MYSFVWYLYVWCDTYRSKNRPIPRRIWGSLL